MVRIIGLFSLLTLGWVTPLIAAGERDSSANRLMALQGKTLKSVSKIHPHLQEARDRMLGVIPPGPHEGSTSLVHVKNGAIQTYIHVERFGSSDNDSLRALGVHIEHYNPKTNIVQAWIPADRLESVSNLSFVTRLTPPQYAHPRTGSKLTQGDEILGGPTMRAAGFTGSGVKVGIISDGADHLSDSVATNDLPASVSFYCSTPPCTTGWGDEGTAMMEIVHDIAPNADLAIGATATSDDFKFNLDKLQNDFGAHVIVDDLGFPAQPYFEDGDVAQAVANAVTAGVIYASAAGNDSSDLGSSHYDAAYTDNGGFHDFGAANGGSSDLTMNILIASGGSIEIDLQWNDRFGHAADDYDLYLYNQATNVILASSTDLQNGTQDPYESLVYDNPVDPMGNPSVVKVVVAKASGSNKRIKMFFYGDILVEEYHTVARSIYGHPAIPGVIAVGAIEAGTGTIEDYSSQGPVKIYFDTLGNPVTETRQKPDVASSDCVNVTGAGNFYTNFCGTSAAAPHVAGIAALLRSGLSIDATDIVNAIKNGATDLGAKGYDNVYGYGIASALGAAQDFDAAPNSTITSPTSNVTIKTGGSLTLKGKCTDATTTSGMTYQWEFGTGSGVADTTELNPGKVVFPNAGKYTVKFTCYDRFLTPDPSPPSINVTVSGPTSTSGGSGGCRTTSNGSLFIIFSFLLAKKRKYVTFLKRDA